MLWLAYDGSLNADWLAHYAVHFALCLPGRQLHAVFVDDGSLASAELARRLDFLRQECELSGVALATEQLSLRRDVARTLLDHIPAGPENYVVCGTRLRPRNMSLLTGTISEQLLAAKHCNVLALRIVQPAVLGAPHQVLVPVMGHPRGFSSGQAFLRLLSPTLEAVLVLMVQGGRGGHTRYVDGEMHAKEPALQYVAQVQRQLRALLPSCVRVEAAVASSPDPPTEIVLTAKQHRSQLIYLGASERSLAKRLFQGAPYEAILARAPCDVAIYRGVP